MRTYRGWWTAAVILVAGTAVVVGSTVTSPWLFVAAGVSTGVVVGAIGASWEDDPGRRWATARTWAGWGVVVTIMLIGLPPAIGPWSLLFPLALGALAPGVILAVRRKASGRHHWSSSPASDLSDDQLARRWKYTSIAVRSTWRTTAELLLLVQERQRLLDELERRDPDGFALWLVSIGWRQAQDH